MRYAPEDLCEAIRERRGSHRVHHQDVFHVYSSFFVFADILGPSEGSRSRRLVLDMPDYNSFEKNRSTGMSISRLQVRRSGQGGKMQTNI
jgi:hypothetical protein